MSKCSDCSLCRGRENTLIQGRGSRPTKTDIFIIQEFPTRSDNKYNTTLTGDTKQKLNYFFEKSGIDYNTVYITSAVKCHVFNASDIKDRNIDECRKYLFNEILTHKPKLIIAMGKAAYKAVSDKKALREFRGHFDTFELDQEVVVNNRKVIKSFKCKIVPSYSLLGSMRKWEYNEDIIRDFKKANKYITEDKIDVTEPVPVNTILTKTGLNDFVEKMREKEYATTDFETTGFDFWRHKIINTGYYSGDGVADIVYLEPYKKEHTEKWTKKEVLRAKEINTFLKHNRDKCISALKTVNAFDHLKFILHNGKFDSKFARKYDIPYKNFYFDTLRADPIIDENLGHALNIAMERRGINFGAYDTKLWGYTNKDENNKKSYQYVPPQLLEFYLGIDVYGDWLLWKKQIIELKKEGMTDFFFKQSMPALHDIEDMEYKGVRYSKNSLLSAAHIIDLKQKKIQEDLVKHTGIDDPKFSNSPKQILNYMHAEDYPFEKLKIKKTKSGYSTGKDELAKFMKYKKWGIFPKILLDAKKLSKIRGTYIDGKGDGGFLQYLDENNRLHASFNLHTPRTSRYSCRKPSLQVFPRPIKGLPNTRSFIIPTNKKWTLFEADYKALEMHIVSTLSKDKILIKELKNETDIHSDNAVVLGRVLQNIEPWITYEHMLVANGKSELIKDPAIIKECLEDIVVHGKDTNFKEIRTRAKNLGFGLNYGKGYKTFAIEFNIPEQDSEDMVDAYFEKYAGVHKWRTNIVKQALNTGVITLLSGRKRRFTGGTDWINNEYAEDMWSANYLKEEIGRQAMNFPVQGGAHEVFEAACIRFNKRIRKEGLQARLLLSIHDGIVGECLTEEVPIIKTILNEELPHTLNKGTSTQLDLGVDVDFYKYEWYGEKLKI